MRRVSRQAKSWFKSSSILNVVYLEEFAMYVTYTRRLGFEDTPDYDYLRGLFTKVLVKLNESDDGVFDWMLLDQAKYDFKVGQSPIHHIK